MLVLPPPMRKPAAILKRFLAALAACLLLAGCFEIREELWVHQDGSGNAELTYVIPAKALLLTGGTEGLEQKIRQMMATQPKLSLDKLEITTSGDGVKVAAKVSTKSLLALRDLKKDDSTRSIPGAAVDIAGVFDVHRRGLDIDFVRTIKVKDALGLAAFAIGKEDRDKRRLTYILHLPKPAAESNAMFIEDDGKTLKWEATLGEAMKKPLVTSFRAQIPIPTAVWYGLGLVAVALIALGRKIWKWRKRAMMARESPPDAGA
ncbi:hypothetical protein [Luteolibacter sp. Populi]|uniref:hypothetical protein n=1 Tax=Luteolibacter sp. Populi TaxID=3230487 RepID=UPI003467D577